MNVEHLKSRKNADPVKNDIETITSILDQYDRKKLGPVGVIKRDYPGAKILDTVNGVTRCDVGDRVLLVTESDDETFLLGTIDAITESNESFTFTINHQVFIGNRLWVTSITLNKNNLSQELIERIHKFQKTK